MGDNWGKQILNSSYIEAFSLQNSIQTENNSEVQVSGFIIHRYITLHYIYCNIDPTVPSW